jgi:hypothetical protein
MNRDNKKEQTEQCTIPDVGGSACAKFSEQITNGTGGFKTWEDREFVVFKDRDKAIVEWTIRCLANPKNKLSAEVLHEITIQRLKVGDKH